MIDLGSRSDHISFSIVDSMLSHKAWLLQDAIPIISIDRDTFVLMKQRAFVKDDFTRERGDELL